MVRGAILSRTTKNAKAREDELARVMLARLDQRFGHEALTQRISQPYQPHESRVILRAEVEAVLDGDLPNRGKHVETERHAQPHRHKELMINRQGSIDWANACGHEHWDNGRDGTDGREETGGHTCGQVGGWMRGGGG